MEVWVVFSGNDEQYEEKEELIDIYVSRSKARKCAKKMMDGYSPVGDNWWKKTVGEDEITWHWCYRHKEKVKETGTYIQIMKYDVK